MQRLQHQIAQAQYRPLQTVQFIGGKGTIVQRRFDTGIWVYIVHLPRNQDAPSDNTTSVELMESEIILVGT